MTPDPALVQRYASASFISYAYIPSLANIQSVCAFLLPVHFRQRFVFINSV